MKTNANKVKTQIAKLAANNKLLADALAVAAARIGCQICTPDRICHGCTVAWHRAEAALKAQI